MTDIASIIKEKRSVDGYLMLAAVDDHIECVLWVDAGEDSESMDSWVVTDEQAITMLNIGEIEINYLGSSFERYASERSELDRLREEYHQAEAKCMARFRADLADDNGLSTYPHKESVYSYAYEHHHLGLRGIAVRYSEIAALVREAWMTPFGGDE